MEIMLTQVLVLQDLYFNNLIKWKDDQGSRIRPVTGNRRPPVPVYRSGLAGYRSEPVKSKFEFKLPSSTGLTGIPAGLAGNRSNSIFFLFWFKFKCSQSILNKYLYNIF